MADHLEEAPFEEEPDELEKAEEPPPLRPIEEDREHYYEILRSIPRPKFLWLDISSLKLTELNPGDAVQQKWITFYSQNLFEALLHGWHVCPSGKSWEILDGRHRWLALKTLELKHHQVGCFIHTGLSREQKAALFAYLNAWKRKIPPEEMYKSLLRAKNPIVVAVQQVQDELELNITARTAMQNVVSKAVSIEEGKDALRFALITLRDSFDDEYPYNQVLIHGLGGFWRKYHDHPHFDVTDFPTRIRRSRISADTLVGRIVSDAKSTGRVSQSLAINWFRVRHDAGRQRRLEPRL